MDLHSLLLLGLAFVFTLGMMAADDSDYDPSFQFLRENIRKVKPSEDEN